MIAVYAAYGAFLTRTDLQERRLPDTLTLTLAAILTGAVLALALTAGAGTEAIAAISGAIGLAILLAPGAIGLAILLAAIGLAGQVGFGDVKLALSVGLLTGWHTWYLPFVAIALAYVLAFPHAITAAILKSRGRDTHDLPFGPYLLAAGAVVAIAAIVPS
uniref:Prepilin type IV endopeptidase peptidase domain-containing protein n=1 Tax=Acrobeloides nanus TaxID=290746 RepID=A0A914CXH6_9BILA